VKPVPMSAAVATSETAAPPQSPLVLHADAPDALTAFVVARAGEALAKSRGLDAAEAVKRALEAAHPGLWHVVIGGPFGLSVAHENGALVLVRVAGVDVLAFQVRPAAAGCAPRFAAAAAAASAKPASPLRPRRAPAHPLARARSRWTRRRCCAAARKRRRQPPPPR